MKLRIRSAIFVLLGLFFVFSHGLYSWADPPDCKLQIEDCSYYECREETTKPKPCLENGYFLRFALPYCNKFMTIIKPTLSVNDGAWLDRVGQCLRNQVDLIPVDTECTELETRAIASHSSCYIETGFCQVSFADKLRIFGVVYKELGDSRMMSALWSVFFQCT